MSEVKRLPFLVSVIPENCLEFVVDFGLMNKLLWANIDLFNY